MTVYVDGIFYKTINEPVMRPYLNLSYNPLKTFKTLISKIGQTSVMLANFTDDLLNSTDISIKGMIYWTNA